MRRGRKAAALLAAAAVLLGWASTPAQAKAATWKWTSQYKVRHLDPTSSGALSCPSTKLCVAASDNLIVYSTRPTVASSWKAYALEPKNDPYLVGGTVGLYSIDCPSVHFCATTDNIGNVFTTTNPAGGAKAWHGREVDGDEVAELTAIGCAGPTACAAIAYTGKAFTLSHGVWHGVQLTSHEGNDFSAVSCPATTLCVAVDNDGYIYRTNPAVGRWSRSKVGKVPGGWDGIDCISVHKCVATGNYDFTDVVGVSTNPAGGRWSAFSVKKTTGLAQVSCRGNFCFSIGSADDLWSSAPAARASAWHVVKPASAYSQTELSCLSNAACLVGSVSGKLALGKR